MRITLTQYCSNFSKFWTVEYFRDCFGVEVAQHVGIAGTTGFDITARINVQAWPGSGTIEIAHTAI